MAGLGGYLYAVGGNDGAASLQSVERYNPHTNKWSRVAPMNRRRAGLTHSTTVYFNFFIFNWSAANIWVFIAQFVKHCRTKAKAKDANPVEALKIVFGLKFAIA